MIFNYKSLVYRIQPIATFNYKIKGPDILRMNKPVTEAKAPVHLAKMIDPGKDSEITGGDNALAASAE